MNDHALPLRDLLTAFTAERSKYLRRRQWNRRLNRTSSLLRPCGHTGQHICEHDVLDRLVCYTLAAGCGSAALSEEAGRAESAGWPALEILTAGVLDAAPQSPDVFLLTRGLELALPILALVTV